MKNRAISFILLTALCLSFISGVNAFAENTADSSAILHIKDSHDFEEFSKNCGLDSYSKNLTVYLDSDLTLEDDFHPVPLFFGKFLGQGHSIEFSNFNSKGSNMGLFRYICQGAEVSDLTVSGSIHLSGTASSVGIIAGQNSGKISNCKAAGFITAKDSAGGITGTNTSEGSLVNCTSSVTVSANHQSGGIAGINNGTLESCTNKGKINTTITKTEENPDIAIDIPGVTGDSRGTVELLDISDSGGIAGFNTGAIRFCTNLGTVGYPHVGYNNGGIVGRQSGIIKGCTNSAEIFGRKDVGGIAGQFEPHITLEFNGNNNQQLKDQLNSLNVQLKELSSQIGSAADNVLLSVGEINSAMEAIEDTLKNHKDESKDDVDEIIQNIHSSFDSISTDSKELISAFDAFNSQAETQIQIILDELKNISDNLSGNVDNLDPILKEIELNTGIIRDSLHNIGNYVENSEAFVQNLNDTIKNQELSFKEKREKIKNLIKDHIANINKTSIKDEIKKIVNASSAIGDQIELLIEALANEPSLKTSLDSILSAQEELNKAAFELGNSLSSKLDDLWSDISILEDNVNGYIGDASQRLDKTFDELYKQLQIINAGVSKLVNSGTDKNAQISGTASNIMGIFSDLGSTVADSLSGPTYKVEDISETMVEKEEPGQICTSENRGTIKADFNVGGIVGIMALEAGNDPEEDYALNENLWGSTTALFRAALIDNLNKGTIDAKNDCAGGAVGRCDLGTIYKCTNMGNIESQSGSFCGGIVGKSASSVVNCDSYCRIKGENQLGGIAGSGENIRNCRALADIEGEGEEHGAIAGIASGKLENNIFVSRGLNGVDNLSFENQTTPMSYDEFIKLPDISPIYSDIKIDFVLEGKTLSTLHAVYGGSIKDEDIPKIPYREDSFGKWEDFEKENIFGNMVVEGKYHPWISTLTSGGRIPKMLVEGDFSDNTVLAFEELSKLPQNVSNEKVIAVYQYEIKDDKTDVPDSLTVRLRCEDPKHSSAAILKDGELLKLDCKTDASCLVFKAPEKATIAIVKESSFLWLYITGGIILLVIIILVICRKKSKKRHKH